MGSSTDCTVQHTPKNAKLKICEDGRWDSLDFLVKYCLYSHTDLKSNKLLNLTLLQVTDAGSSAKMEGLGYEKSIDCMLNDGLKYSYV